MFTRSEIGTLDGTRPAASRLTAHAWAAAWFAVLAVLISYPLVLVLDSEVAGAGPGDNLAFLWSAWWARHLAGAGQLAGYLRTDYLFAPFGTSLVLHTHTALESILAGAALQNVPLVRAHNLVLLAGLAANGFAAYLLALRFTRRAMPATVAGTSFASCAYLSVHLLGHVNLTHAWVLPLACLAWVAMADAPSLPRAGVVAVSYAAATYTDYYYLTYATFFAVVWSAVSLLDLRAEWGPARLPRLERALLVVAAAAAIAALAISLTSGIVLDIGPVHVSARQARNSTALAGLCGLAWLVLCTRLRAVRPAATDVKPLGRSTAAAIACYALLAAPVLIGGLALLRSGDYVSQRYFWRSAPRGVDVATLVLGPPMHGWSGAWTTAADQAMGIDRIEHTAWLGIVASVLLVCAVRSRFRPTAPGASPAAFAGHGLLERDRRRWLWVCVAFGIWALGPSLVVAGYDTGILLPQTLARYVPIVSNARMPGRAIVMVQLAAAVLGALLLSALAWPAGRIALLTAFIVVEGSSLPFPTYRVPAADAVDARLRNAGAAAVIELPSGLRDGFGEWGRFDHRALAHQMAHGRRLAGGFAARVPPSVTAAYRASPGLAALFDWSEGTKTADTLPGDLGSLLEAAGVQYVVVNEDALPTNVLRGPLEARGLRFVTSAGARALYSVE